MTSDKPIANDPDQNSFKYDVAFSFLAQDESLATELNDLLQDRLKTFLYSKRQGEIAGTDGGKTFNRVFGEESRIVVVLYRPEWGSTPWTRIEETAICNRAYVHGHDFVLIIPIDDPPTSPKWLPKTRLWIGLNRWGLEGATSVIEARVQEQGGEPHEETVQECADRLKRELKFSECRDKFLNSFEGVHAANQEFELLDKEIQRLIIEIKNSIDLNIKRDMNQAAAVKQILILGFKLGFRVIWKCHYTNTLDNSLLAIELWDDHPPFPGIINYDAKKIRELKFRIDITPSKQYIWHQAPNKQQYDTIQLASFILKQFMNELQKQNIRK
jgi:hypothetical protein